MKISDAIRTSYLAAGLAAEHLDFLASIGEVIEFAAGEEITRQFEPARDLMILCRGSARIHGVLGEPIGWIKSGMPIGEVSFLDGRPRSGTVVAQDACTVLVLPAEPLLARMTQSPDFSSVILWNMCQVLCSRLRATNQHLEALMALDEQELRPRAV